MSTRTNWNPADLPGIGSSTKAVYASGNTSSKISTEYISLDATSPQAAHASAGEVIIFCVLGEVLVRVEDTQFSLQPNELAHVGAGSLYQIAADDPSAVVLTTLLVTQPASEAPRTHLSNDDEVQEASEESFPASDSPSFNPGT